MVDIAAEAAGSAALGRQGRVGSELVRFLAPGRAGPVRAEPRVVASTPTAALVEVRVTDAGADDRLVAVATLAVA
jgi:acyl-coenzyme A thioesterase PaaI-like protein